MGETNRKKKSKGKPASKQHSSPAKYPRHSVAKALRIPKAILDQNAGRACTVKEAANFVGVGAHGPFKVEVSSASKYGFLDRLEGKIQPSELAKRILRPQSENDELQSYRKAVLKAPDISDIYKHYRGENLPDTQFFNNTIVDNYGIPRDKVDEFKEIFLESLGTAKLLDKRGDKIRVIDASEEKISSEEKSERIKQLGKSVKIEASVLSHN